jgi:hypothetical protein
MTSSQLQNRGRLPHHDPANHKMQSQVAKSVNSALAANLETKVAEYLGASTVTSAGTIVSATQNLVRGDASVNNCTGILIKPKSLELRYIVSATTGYNTFRVIVFRWKDSNAPLPSGVLNSTGSPFAPLSNLSWVNHRKIKVLHDTTMILYDHGAGVSAKTRSVMIDPGKAVIQLPLTGAGSTPQMDGIYVLLISDDALPPTPTVDIQWRLEFTDA